VNAGFEQFLHTNRRQTATSFLSLFENPNCGPRRDLQCGGERRGQAPACPKKAVSKELALRELEAFASALLSVLLALMLAGIPSEHSQFLQLGAQLNVELQQRARDP